MVLTPKTLRSAAWRTESFLLTVLVCLNRCSAKCRCPKDYVRKQESSQFGRRHIYQGWGIVLLFSLPWDKTALKLPRFYMEDHFHGNSCEFLENHLWDHCTWPPDRTISNLKAVSKLLLFLLLIILYFQRSQNGFLSKRERERERLCQFNFYLIMIWSTFSYLQRRTIFRRM